MADKYILSIDPGKSSGVALGRYSETEPYSLVEAWQFMGGVRGLLDWLTEHRFTTDMWAFGQPWFDFPGWGLDSEVICEKFTPLQNAGFNLTLDSVEPLRCEGALIAKKMMPPDGSVQWRRPVVMYKYGGDNLKEKKARAYKFLKDNGMYLTGKTVGQPDAFDARSATLHGISYLVDVVKHKPTYEMLVQWNDANRKGSTK